MNVTKRMLHDDVLWYCKCGQVTPERECLCWHCDHDRTTHEIQEHGYGALRHVAIDDGKP